MPQQYLRFNDIKTITKTRHYLSMVLLIQKLRIVVIMESQILLLSDVIRYTYTIYNLKVNSYL